MNALRDCLGTTVFAPSDQWAMLLPMLTPQAMEIQLSAITH